MASYCRICGERSVAEWKQDTGTCDDCCPHSEDGKHYADVSTLHWVDVTIFDIQCKFCYQTGSLHLDIEPEDVNW